MGKFGIKRGLIKNTIICYYQSTSSLNYVKSVKNAEHVALTTAWSSSATAWINDALSSTGPTGSTRRIPAKSIVATSNGYGCSPADVGYESNDDAADAWLRRSSGSATSATLQRRSPVIIALQTKAVCSWRHASSRPTQPGHEGRPSRWLYDVQQSANGWRSLQSSNPR